MIKLAVCHFSSHIYRETKQRPEKLADFVNCMSFPYYQTVAAVCLDRWIGTFCVSSVAVRENYDKDSDVSTVWRKIINECAHFYLRMYPNLSDKAEYQTISQKIWQTYPSIGHDGP